MEEQLGAYEETKKSIRMKMARKAGITDDLDDFDQDYESPGRQVDISNIAQIGGKVVIGTGLGLLAGVATIAVTASVAEMVIVGAVTKVAGVVGGAVGLITGINKFKAKKKKMRQEAL